MLVIQSKLLFGEIYKYREGCRYFQNNWCMGPFYSYDANEKDIRKSWLDRKAHAIFIFFGSSKINNS